MTLVEREKKEYKAKINMDYGTNVPINPFTGYLYNDEKYAPILEDFEKGAKGYYATKTQWVGSGYNVSGKPVMKRKLYGKAIEYFSYEQAEGAK